MAPAVHNCPPWHIYAYMHFLMHMRKDTQAAYAGTGATANRPPLPRKPTYLNTPRSSLSLKLEGRFCSTGSENQSKSQCWDKVCRTIGL